jgi:hypothetical protein
MMGNPLDANCQAFKTDASGKVIGVELGITEVPGAKYIVHSVRLRDEIEANGQTIAACHVYDTSGLPTGEQVRLTWPGRKPPFNDSGLPGNPNNVHVIANGYTPPNQGPLALHVGSFNAPISDIVYGLGLPFNRHVSFDVVFKERSLTPPDDTDAQRIAKLEAWARDWSRNHPGGPQYD